MQFFIKPTRNRLAGKLALRGPNDLPSVADKRIFIGVGGDMN